MTEPLLYGTDHDNPIDPFPDVFERRGATGIAEVGVALVEVTAELPIELLA